MAIQTEYNRLKSLLQAAKIPPSKIDAMEPILDNLSAMRIKLDEVRAEIIDAEIVVEYQNGETQTGTHINPLFKAYEELLKTYLSFQPF